MDSKEEFDGRAALLPGAKVCGQDHIPVLEPTSRRGLADGWLLNENVFGVHFLSSYWKFLVSENLRREADRKLDISETERDDRKSTKSVH